MKTKKILLGYVLSVIVLTLSMFFVGCSNEEIETASAPTNLTLNISNNTGYSTGELILQPTGETLGNIRIDLSKIKIEVEADQLGKVSLTGQTDPAITDVETESSMSKNGTKSFTFSDTQTATAVWNYLYEVAALNHWELTDVQYVDYDYELVNDEGTMARITLNFDAICQQFGNKTDVKRFTLSPSYYQVVKGVKVDDTAIVTTHDGIGGSTGDVTAAEAAFTADVWLKLAQTSINVTKDKLGKVNLSTAGTPQTTAISKTDSIGEQITFADNFADSQKASVTIRNAHSKSAEFYYSITSLKYVDYTATAVNDKTYLIKLHYRGTYVHSNGSKQGTFELYPSYYQVLEDEQPALTYKVTESPTKNDLTDSRSDYLTVIIKRSDGKKWTLEELIAQCGTAKGRKVLGVTAPATTTGYNDTDYEREDSGVETKNGFTISTSNHIYRRDTKYKAEISDNLTSESEILFTTKSIKFVDPETGWEWKKDYVQRVEITSGNIETIAGKQQTYSEQGYNYKYLATHKITFKCYLNGELYKQSISENDLYERQ